tara:strand:- start:1331 stop:1549 length:219 start_codon:yes stop_codon:yes gene_type:complete
MDIHVFTKRLNLLFDSREKLSSMKRGNVFNLDLEAVRLIENLSTELKYLISENYTLEEQLENAQSLRTEPNE